MHRFPFQSWLNYNPPLPARGKLSTPVNSPHHTGQENVWFVECSTTARATPASSESVLQPSCQILFFSLFFCYPPQKHKAVFLLKNLTTCDRSKYIRQRFKIIYSQISNNSTALIKVPQSTRMVKNCHLF